MDTNILFAEIAIFLFHFQNTSKVRLSECLRRTMSKIASVVSNHISVVHVGAIHILVLWENIMAVNTFSQRANIFTTECSVQIETHAEKNVSKKLDVPTCRLRVRAHISSARKLFRASPSFIALYFRCPNRALGEETIYYDSELDSKETTKRCFLLQKPK